MKQFDVIIIGAGAAGLFCAAQLGQSGLRVLILEQGKKIGRKILMSGGGNCNFTNIDVTPQHYICRNRHFVKSALAGYRSTDFITLVEQYQIAYYEKERGQLFCQNGAQQIVMMLAEECRKGKVEIKLKQAVSCVKKLYEDERDYFSILTENHIEYQTKSLVVATGGLSMPALGVSPFGYKIAQQFGMNVIPPKAGLVPFTWGEKLQPFMQLSGISLPVIVRSESGQIFDNHLLFTHRGLSGPAMLQISNYWQLGESLTINFLPSKSINDILLQCRHTSPKQQLKTLLAHHLPKKLVELWIVLNWITDKPIAEMSKVEQQKLSEIVHNWRWQPNGTEGYRHAEVTLGGVDTDFISSKTMEAKTTPHLYFIGEVLDVTGWLGGYNFQWAWSSAFACAKGIVADIK